MGCKPPIANLLRTLADTCNVGSGGCIARCTIFAAATQDVSGMLWPNYQRHSIRRISVLCGKLTTQTGNLPIDCFNLSLWLLALSVSKNWWSSLHSISTRGQPQGSMRDGIWRIQSMRYASAKVQKVGKGLPRQRWPLPRQSYDYTGCGSTYTRAYKASTTLPPFETLLMATVYLPQFSCCRRHWRFPNYPIFAFVCQGILDLFLPC